MAKAGNTALQRFLSSESAGGVVLMVVAALALVVANSPLAETYDHTLHAYVGGLSVLHWINDGLMAIFFLLVGLEIKREVVAGELSTRMKRRLPVIAALGGMVVPALIYVAFNLGDAHALKGWAIPGATDIAFALGVISLAGPQVPRSLKTFLVALAIIDDLGAVLIIALFYTAGLNLLMLGLAAGVFVLLIILNRLKVGALAVYLVLGALMWFFMLKSGVHATIAGVLTALTVPMAAAGRAADDTPLHRLEHALSPWVGFAILPVFAFANAGVSFAGINLSHLLSPVPIGVAAGLFVGKQAGVFLASRAAIRLGWAERPAGSGWRQLYGVSVLCGIGFTMSLFIGMLAFEDPLIQNEVKLGVFLGSIASGLIGWAILRFWAPARPAEQRA